MGEGKGRRYDIIKGEVKCKFKTTRNNTIHDRIHRMCVNTVLCAHVYRAVCTHYRIARNTVQSHLLAHQPNRMQPVLVTVALLF